MLTPSASENVRAPALARERPVTVLGHAHSRAGHHKRDDRRHVERPPAVAARPARIDQRRGIAAIHPRHLLPHRARESVDLIRRLPLHVQRDEKRGKLRRGRLAFKTASIAASASAAEEVAAVHNLVKEIQKGHGILESSACANLAQALNPMKIHEYQAKAILARYGVPVPRGEVAFTPEEAEAAAKDLGGGVVVKAQIHAGGRGKGGGVKVAKDATEAPRWPGKFSA